MTKTLTEQYKFGEINTGYYWCKIWGEDAFVIKWLVGDDEIHQTNLIEEVLAPVPSYDEWQSYDKCADMLIDVNKKWHKTIVENKKLKKQLAIATKALERIYQPSVGDIYNFETDELDNTKLQDIAGKALKEMEGVK